MPTIINPTEPKESTLHVKAEFSRLDAHLRPGHLNGVRKLSSGRAAFTILTLDSESLNIFISSPDVCDELVEHLRVAAAFLREQQTKGAA